MMKFKSPKFVEALVPACVPRLIGSPQMRAHRGSLVESAKKKRIPRQVLRKTLAFVSLFFFLTKLGLLEPPV